jgi:hypothetical protein
VNSSRDYDTAPAAGELSCEHCGQRIGVYEPMVELQGDLTNRTSRAADPRLDSGGAGTVFHAACYDRRVSPRQTTQQ